MFGARAAVGEANGAYEIWVVALRRWSRDPAVSLEGLPALSEDMFERETFDRLVAHMNRAIETFMDGWHAQLTAAFSRAATPHDLTVELVNLRHGLQPRLRLSRHPSLPAPLREAYEKQLGDDLAEMQRQLEEGARQDESRGRSQRERSDALLRALRSAPLTSLADGNAVERGEETREPPGRALVLDVGQTAAAAPAAVRRRILHAATATTNTSPTEDR